MKLIQLRKVTFTQQTKNRSVVKTSKSNSKDDIYAELNEIHGKYAADIKKIHDKYKSSNSSMFNKFYSKRNDVESTRRGSVDKIQSMMTDICNAEIENIKVIIDIISNELKGESYTKSQSQSQSQSQVVEPEIFTDDFFDGSPSSDDIIR